MKRQISNAVAKFFPKTLKRFSELQYWKKKKVEEGELGNEHYKYFYTEHFGLDDSFYRNKRVLDIGCGPRGSLEWANMAKKRVGLDPLANSYLKLGADKHAMKYVNSTSESMPFEDSSFDVTCSFNSLDHVNNPEKSISEIKRVTTKGGLYLLLVEINHEPTACEPHSLEPKIVRSFEPEFVCRDIRIFKPHSDGLYASIQTGDTFQDPLSCTDPGWLSAKFEKVS